MEANNMKAMREASAPVPCDHVLTLDEAIAHAEECADNTPCGSQHRQLADWLKELKTLKTSVSCGNGAKIREALEYVLHFDATDEAAMEDGLTDAERIAEYADHIKECQKKANAALAASARNCDRFKTKEEAAIAFANENKQWIPQQVLWELAPWLDWLFATAGVGRKE